MSKKFLSSQICICWKQKTQNLTTSWVYHTWLGVYIGDRHKSAKIWAFLVSDMNQSKFSLVGSFYSPFYTPIGCYIILCYITPLSWISFLELKLQKLQQILHCCTDSGQNFSGIEPSLSGNHAGDIFDFVCWQVPKFAVNLLLFMVELRLLWSQGDSGKPFRKQKWSK